MGVTSAATGTVTIALAVLVCALPAHAQSPAPDRPGPFVIDVRAATIGVPRSAGFYPPVPAGTIVPARAVGVDVGVHVFVANLGPARLGLGASVLRQRGTAPQTAAVATSSSAAASAAQEVSGTALAVSSVEADVSGIAPQVSFSFGTRDGWSSLGAGVGRMRIRTKAFTAAGGSVRDPGSVTAINAGGGARWFLTSRMAVGFDLRFYRLSSSPRSATPHATLLSASFGLSFR